MEELLFKLADSLDNLAEGYNNLAKKLSSVEEKCDEIIAFQKIPKTQNLQDTCK